MLLARFLLGSLWGTLALVVAAYFGLRWVGYCRPLSFWELFVWYDELPEGTQGLLISSFLTVVGFSVAFATATMNWRQEMQANLRLDASREVDSTYNQTCSLITAVEIFSSNCLEVFRKQEAGADPLEVERAIRIVLQRLPQFEADRLELSATYRQACQITGRYSSVLLASGDAQKRILAANKAISEVTDKMWIFIPGIDPASVNVSEVYFRFVEQTKLTALITECRKAHHFVSANSGHVKGRLNYQLLENNLSLVVNFFRLGGAFVHLSRASQNSDPEDTEKQVAEFEKTILGQDPKRENTERKT